MLQQSLACLGAAKAIDLLAKNLSINVNGEKGIDAGGLTRDWFDTLGRALAVSAETGEGHLMVLPDKTLAPRPYDTRFSDLYATGRLIGLALWFGIPLPLPLGTVTCKFMLDVPISPVDLQRLDPDFVQFRVKPILRPSGVSDLEAALGEPLTFMSAATEERASKELCPGGEQMRVTEENKQEYLKLLCEHHLCGDTQEQIKVLLEGLWDIFPKDSLTCSGITHRELALLISGYPSIDVDDWRAHTKMNFISPCDQVVAWFWEMVKEMSEEERAKLLHFATGSSRLPSNGFAGVSPDFNISIQGDETEHLPHAHTCGNQLVLPRYTSREQLVEKFKIALSNDEGFGFA
jgi:E3 ubiquitin-protein ligase HUWE1